MNKRGFGKKALAPLITTILLVLIVIVLAGIILLWGMSFLPEAIGKFEQPIENACSSLAFSAQYSSSSREISVSNTGDIPIYELGIKQEGWKKSEIIYEKVNVNSGAAVSIPVSKDPEADEITLIPVLLGKAESGKIQKYSCPEENWYILDVSGD